MRLFEQEVPEIYDNTVAIKGCAREAGERTKIAVSSRDRDVDSVGACVGMKGMRVQSIIRELRGEKIDIIEHNQDPVSFAANALSPAKINHVSVVDSEQKHLEVIVDDTQLSLAIGKKGQNVRLASKLLGWRIDIKSEEEKRQEIESQMAAMALRGAPISKLEGLGEKTLQRLRDHGVETVEQLAQMTPAELTEISGIGEKTVERIRRVVTEYFEADRSAAEAAEAEAVAAEAAGAAAAAAETKAGDAATAGEPQAEAATGEAPVGDVAEAVATTAGGAATGEALVGDVAEVAATTAGEAPTGEAPAEAQGAEAETAEASVTITKSEGPEGEAAEGDEPPAESKADQAAGEK
jgi:N utilization substance protein A